MELQNLVRDIFLLIFVLVIPWELSTTRADDDAGFATDDSDEVGVDVDSSEEVMMVTRRTMPSGTASLISTVAMTRRLPRGINEGCIQSKLCASDGLFYNDTCQIQTRNLQLLASPAWCETGCAQPQPVPCPKKVPVCAGAHGVFKVYEDECHLNRTRCQNMGMEIPLEKIGKCQQESIASQLTCHDILRGGCPRGTMSSRVCDLNDLSDGKPKRKTYRNVCRVLHKRCKHKQDICYHLEQQCPSSRTDLPPLKDCSQYILEDFPIGPSGRTCYVMPTSSSTDRCTCDPSTAPILPIIPPMLLEYATT